MALSFYPADDLVKAVDGLETVTLYHRGSSEQTVVTHALRRAVTTREARARNRFNTWKAVASDGRYTASDLNWHLPTVHLDRAPRLGDVIVHAEARRWTILDVRLTTLRTRWTCSSRNLAVVYGLDDTVSILKANYIKGDAGAAEPVWCLWKTGVRARIQPFEADMGTQHQAMRATRRFQIFIEEDVALDHRHCIQGPDGTVYRIIRSLGVERIGELQSIDAEATSWTTC